MVCKQLLDVSVGMIGGADGLTSVFVGGSLPADLAEALRIMGNGMLGIFVVIGLIAMIVALLGRMGNGRP
ncbi:hypothetical protein [Acutalibacter caecimuris]|uniref:hypothetical protein n=1 Tax=Acutalibacter caecimuris TaxID=3093657 RepID=UPI002AC8AAC2|nr:hypothetical protein [Acutalibacter sp. M00118]